MCEIGKFTDSVKIVRPQLLLTVSGQAQIGEADERAFHMRSELQVVKSTDDTADALFQHHSRYMTKRIRSKLTGCNEVRL